MQCSFHLQPQGQKDPFIRSTLLVYSESGAFDFFPVLLTGISEIMNINWHSLFFPVLASISNNNIRTSLQEICRLLLASDRLM